MAAESQKLSKEELREDEFVEWIMEAVEYVKERSQLFIGGLAGLVVVILLINHFIESSEAAEVEAVALLGDVLMAEQSGQVSEAIRLAEQLATSYTGAPAAGQGLVLLANMHYAEGRIAEARGYYRDYLDNYEPIDVLAYAAESGLASCLEAEGQLLEAGRYYEAYAGRETGSIRAALALMEAARVYGLAGDGKKQRELLEAVSRDFAQYPVALQARASLGML
ncbi:MAG: hypothetical protein CME20_24805 [Gemmatimonadetes bacterium]|nr:hypothetical protein [Gemmatimonadota bacterium]